MHIDITNDDDGGVFRSVPAIEELLRILQLIRHRFDVFYKAHRRVTVGVFGKSQRPCPLIRLRRGVGDILEILSFDCQCLSTKYRFRVFQILEPVGLNFDHLLQVGPGKGNVVVGEIVGRKCVRICTCFLHNIGIDIRGILFGSAKHHVLKKMGET